MQWFELAGGLLTLLVGFISVGKIISKNVEKQIRIEFTNHKSEISEEIKTLSIRIDGLSDIVNNNEKERLACEIAKFTAKLRKNYKPSVNEYKQFYVNYSNYKKLHGNSFLEKEKEYVDKKYLKHCENEKEE